MTTTDPIWVVIRKSCLHVLWRISFKKYFGVAHEHKVEFYPKTKDLFLKGLEIVKRGASSVLKDVVYEVIHEMLDLRNTRDVMDVVKQAIEKTFTTDWSIDAFAKSAVYRPDKKNISVLKMIARYRNMNYHSIPDPNVRFKYIICKYFPWTYDAQGRQTVLSAGDRMELVSRVKDEDLEIDLEYYFDKELTGQIARMITFCDIFKNTVSTDDEIDISLMNEFEIDALNKEVYKRSEVALFNAAKKHIGQMAKHYSNAYVNKGKLFKNTWSEVCNFIGARPEFLTRRLTIANLIVIRFFTNSTGDAHRDMIRWAKIHIMRRYRVVLDNDQLITLSRELERASQYIKTNKLEGSLLDCIDAWKCNVVTFIRGEYDFDYICKNNLQHTTLWDVLDRYDLEIILSMNELMPIVKPDIAMRIIDMMARAIASALTVSQVIK